MTFPWALAFGVVSFASAADPAPSRKQAMAVRVPDGTVVVDGRLDDAIWATAVPITDFLRKEPAFGTAPREPLWLRFAYDDGALYVAARCEVRDRTISAPLSRRDKTGQAEHLWISLDTYHDLRTAYSFGVTATGVRMDGFHGTDLETDFDATYDPVWEAKTTIDSAGWSAEFRIPFTQLRFNDVDELVFGLNVDRWVPALQEDVFWIPVPKDATGWSSRMGELRGISGIRPSRRIEILPYAATAVTTGEDRGDPLRDGWDQTGRIGADFKMGLGPNLTLESTVRPDFGQVEADPAEVNLTAFETFFDERRPFFTEGADIFQSDDESGYFYSRRIGAAPRGPAEGDDVRYPTASEILGAAKLSGRLGSGLAIGSLFAVTGGEDAQVFDASTRGVRSVQVGPRTIYGVTRLRQEFGKETSTAGLLLAGVSRDLDAVDPLASLYARCAVSGEADWNYRFGGRRYNVTGRFGFTHVSGEPAAIAVLQRSSARYFQRPDATHVRFDPTRTSLTGYSGWLGHSRLTGRYPYLIGCGFESPDLEKNDIGRLSTSDSRYCQVDLEWHDTHPGFFYEKRIELKTWNEWNYAGEAQEHVAGVESLLTWRNYWQTTFESSLILPSQDERLSRGGPTMGRARRIDVSVQQATNVYSPTRGHVRIDYGTDQNGYYGLQLSGGVTFRPEPRLELQLTPSYLRLTDPRLYVDTLAGGRPGTYDNRYIFATVDQTTFLAQIRLGLTLKPDLNLDVYAEPFASSGRYYKYGELLAPRSRLLREYGTDGTSVLVHADGSRTITDGDASFDLPAEDFRTLSFRSNVVLRWEYRPGSTLYAVWQRNLSSSRPIYARAGFDDLFDSFGTQGDNVFAVKMSYHWGLK